MGGQHHCIEQLELVIYTNHLLFNFNYTNLFQPVIDSFPDYVSVQILLENGANVNLTDSEGFTALMGAFDKSK